MAAIAQSTAIDAVATMAARGINVELGNLTEAKAWTLEYIMVVVSDMSGNKFSRAGMKRHCRDVKTSMFCMLHIRRTQIWFLRGEVCAYVALA